MSHARRHAVPRWRLDRHRGNYRHWQGGANTVLTHAAGASGWGGDVKGGDPNRSAKTDGGTFAAFSKSAPVVRTATLTARRRRRCSSVWRVARRRPDGQSGTTKSTARTGKRSGKSSERYGAFAGQDSRHTLHNDAGGASATSPKTVGPSSGITFQVCSETQQERTRRRVGGLPEKQKVHER